jgi:hypothetical protein
MAQIDRIDRAVRNELILQTGGYCPIPRCDNEVSDVFPLDGNVDGPSSDNFVPLCQKHYALVMSGVLNQEMLLTVRKLLSSVKTGTKAVVRELKSRADYLNEVVSQISTTGEELYVSYIGPLCLHPDWYFERRDATTKMPNMDRSIRNFLRTHSSSPSHRIRIIFRNTRRYRDKVNEAVRPTEHKRFISEVLQEIESIWGPDGEKGPDLCCYDPGFFHIQVIFAKAAVSASRPQASAPIESGLLHLEPSYVTFEKRSFNQLFDLTNRGRKKDGGFAPVHVKSLEVMIRRICGISAPFRRCIQLISRL